MMIHRFVNLFIGSLRRQMVSLMVLVMALAMTLFVVDQIQRQQRVLQEQQSSQAVVLARSVATSGAVWLASRDYGGLNGIVESIAHFPDLEYAIVLDTKGQVLAHTDPARVRMYMTDLPTQAQPKVFARSGHVADVANPVFLSGHHIGWVRIGLSGATTHTQLADASWKGLWLTLGVIVLSVPFAWWAASRMTRRLQTIQTVADAVQNGETQLRVNVKGQDEAARLARQFNAMLDSLAQQTQERLRRAAELLALLRAIPDLIFVNHSDGNYLEVHASDPHLLFVPPHLLLGRRPTDVLPAPVGGQFMAAIEAAVSDQSVQTLNYALHVDGSEKHFEARLAPFGDDRAISMVRDTTERERATFQLRRAANVFTFAREGIFITSPAGEIVDVNASFCRITGYSREEAIGNTPHLLYSGRHDSTFYAGLWSTLHDKGHWEGEIWNRRKSGEVFAEMLNISAVKTAQGVVAEYVAMFSDISSLKEQQKQLEHMAHFDSLTGLPNRLLLSDRLTQAMARSVRYGKKLAVAYLDLDEFKQINDNYGHDVGDQVLVLIAQNVKAVLREADTLARLGGDEFVVIVVDLEDIHDSDATLQRILTAAIKPLLTPQFTAQVSASIGVTYYPQAQAVDADQLIRQADQTMYTAKMAGKNRFHVFDTEHDYSVRSHFQNVENLRAALMRREFVLYYQPKVNMRTGDVMGVEALIRWQHPVQGLLPPAAFLPLVGDDQLAIELGEWVIHTALSQVQAWMQLGLQLNVSVNVGAYQLQQSNFVDRLRAILMSHPQLSPTCLEVEILETSALADLAKISQVISSCNAMGVAFSLDDFGTGYSSLSYLKHLRVQTLKIDQGFVRDIFQDPDDLAILRGIISLAAIFKHKVIAEGVETQQHGIMLQELGCDCAQGYGIARPMPAHQIPNWVVNWKQHPTWQTPA